MHFIWGSSIIAILSLVFVAAGVYLLNREAWLVIWLRSTAGIFLLAIAIYLLSLIYPMSKFDSLSGSVRLAEVTATELESGVFQLQINLRNGRYQQEHISRESFSFSILTIDWIEALRNFGLQRGYSFGSIYEGPTADGSGEQGVREIAGAEASKKAWQTLYKMRMYFPFISFKEDRTEEMTLKDGGKYVITVTNLGIRYQSNIKKLEEEEGEKVEEGEKAGEAAKPADLDTDELKELIE